MITAFEHPFDLDVLPTVFNDILFVLAAAVIALVVTRSLRLVIHVAITQLARRSHAGSSNFWNVRSPRSLTESDEVSTLRREQRIRAVSLMLGRMAGVAVWLILVVLVLAGLNVSVVWAVSSAGFLGAGVAIGGQHTVHDYLNGLHILLEDRFGEGDDIEIVTAAGLSRRGTVERLGAFGTRLRGEDNTWHLSNRMLFEVSNFSQRGHSLEFGFEFDGSLDQITVERTLQSSLEAIGVKPTGSGVVVDNLQTASLEDIGVRYRVEARTAVPLDDSQQVALEETVLSALANKKKKQPRKQQ